METNIGAFDGSIRILFFIIAIIFSIMTGQWWWLIPGAILFATALLTWCPIYAIIGLNSHNSGTGQ